MFYKKDHILETATEFTIKELEKIQASGCPANEVKYYHVPYNGIIFEFIHHYPSLKKVYNFQFDTGHIYICFYIYILYICIHYIYVYIIYICIHCHQSI